MAAPDPGAQAVLTLEGVSKSFGELPAVEAVSLEVRPGEMFALLGASGCGKTTLLRLIAGFEEAETGRILIDGADMKGVPAHRRPVTTVFQSYALFPHMSVAENVAFGLKQDGLARQHISERVAAMLDLVQLSAMADRRPDQISGGQRQRVALARSLVKLPKLLLLDEPLAALDRKLREQMQTELARIQAEIGIAFLLVTHDQEEAMAIAHRMAVMRAGMIEQIGTPRDIYTAPQTTYVADFIGQVTLFEGSVAKREGDTLVVAPGNGAPLLRVLTPEAIGDGTRVAVAVRPERIVPDIAGRAGPDMNKGRGRIDEIRYRGDTTLVRLRLPNGSAVRLSVASVLASAWRLADEISFAWPPEAGTVLVQ
jgi:putrescine transport system ATP-binding protein